MADLSVSVVASKGISPLMGDPLTLSVSGNHFVNGSGQTVRLRGVNTEGVANFTAFFVPGSPGLTSINAYIDNIPGPDSTATEWNPTVVRLNFERYPCADPTRLYQAGDVRIPYCIPDTAQFPEWAATTSVIEGSVYKYNGTRYSAAKRYWRADMGQAWNPGHFNVGDRVVGLPIGDNHVYECTAFGTTLSGDWGGGPSGTSGTPQVDVLGNTWVYVGEWGTTGSSQPFSGTTMEDFYGEWYLDAFVMWSIIGPDLTPEEAETAWSTFLTTVLNPTVQRCIDNSLYCFICDFDFGPADLPLRTARMMDFWGRMSESQWANHPRVMFDLWNESLDVGGFAGWTWTNQKPYIQDAVDLIRANGANNIVLVTTPAFCAYTDLATVDPLTGSNLVYASHLYSDFYEGSNDAHLATALASGQAVMVSEWGSNQVANVGVTDAFINDLMGQCEPSRGATNPAAGWMAWSFSRFWDPGFFTNDAYTTPNYFGESVRDLFTEFA